MEFLNEIQEKQKWIAWLFSCGGGTIFLHFSTSAATAFNRYFHAFILNSLFQVVRETYPDALEQAVFCVPVVKCLVGC